jgi:organic radical activating enzyme
MALEDPDLRGTTLALEQMKVKLDRVSPSFCLAKWLQVTLHTHNGFNHSCHHPIPHKIPADLLAKDPSALHNTPFKKQMRRMMLEGKRPPECEYCWKVEDTPGGHLSDRVLKSSDHWASFKLDEIAKADPDANVNPTYLEVSFGHECNFRCSYCDPYTSSALWASVKKHGPYIHRPSLEQVHQMDKTPLPAENNPYVKAFWEWFPSLAPELEVLRVTGGEPLINKNTYLLLDYIDKNPLPNLRLCINSNLGIPEASFQKFIDRLKSLTDGKKIRDFKLYTSVDTFGEQAEYLRVGLDYKQWRSRVSEFLTRLPWEVTIMVTFNVLSVSRFRLLLDDVMILNRSFFKTVDGKKDKRILVDISHLTTPDYFSIWTLTSRWINKLDDLALFMRTNSFSKIGWHGFHAYETFKMDRVAEWALNTAQQRKQDSVPLRAAFYVFTRQYEKREGKSFLSIFPEMTDYYLACESAVRLQGPDFLKRHHPALGPEFWPQYFENRI